MLYKANPYSFEFHDFQKSKAGQRYNEIKFSVKLTELGQFLNSFFEEAKAQHFARKRGGSEDTH